MELRTVVTLRHELVETFQNIIHIHNPKCHSSPVSAMKSWPFWAATNFQISGRVSFEATQLEHSRIDFVVMVDIIVGWYLVVIRSWWPKSGDKKLRLVVYYPMIWRGFIHPFGGFFSQISEPSTIGSEKVALRTGFFPTCRSLQNLYVSGSHNVKKMIHPRRLT